MALNPVSFTSPSFDYSAEQSQIARQQAMAAQLQQQAAQPLDATQSAGGWAIPISPWQGLAKVGQGAASGIHAARAEQGQRDLAARAQKELADVLRRGTQAQTGTPASMSPGSELSPAFENPAVAPDMAKAGEIYMSHPMTAPMGMQLAQQGAQQQMRQQMMADIMRGDQPNPMGAGGGSVMAPPPQPGQPAPQQQGGISPAQAMRMIGSGDAGLAAVGQAALKQFAIPASEQAKMDQADRHFGGVSGNKQAELVQARDLHATPSGSALLSNRLGEAHLAETVRHNQMSEGDPTTIEAAAQGIASGNLQPLSGFALARPMGQQIMARVMQINPNFSAKDYGTGQKAEKDFATGKQGQAVKSFNVALAHLDTLDQLATGLHNGDVQLINKASNMISTQTGQAAPTNFNAAKKIVADEIVKAIIGSGGGVGDREEANKQISAANSPAQLRGVINTYKELMRGQLGGLQQQYETSTGRKDFNRFLSPSAQQTAHGGAGAPAPTSDVRSQADAILGNR